MVAERERPRARQHGAGHREDEAASRQRFSQRDGAGRAPNLATQREVMTHGPNLLRKVNARGLPTHPLPISKR